MTAAAFWFAVGFCASAIAVYACDFHRQTRATRNALRNADAACDELAQRVADLELQRATAQANVLALTCAVHDAAAADVRDAVVLRGDLLQRFNWN
jgi:hypothetical protein